MKDEGNAYYVYVYIDPRNFEEFYYGKGKGSRKEAHQKEAKRNEEDNDSDVDMNEIQEEVELDDLVGDFDNDQDDAE